MHLKLLFGCGLFFVVSCGPKAQTENPSTIVSDSDSTTTTLVDDKGDWSAFVDGWSEALTRQDFATLKTLYADTVMYYGDDLLSSTIFGRQKSYLIAHANYRQRIPEIIKVEKLPSGDWHVRFSKEVFTDNGSKTYPSSLVLSKRGENWKIVLESDDATDLNKARGIPTPTFAYAPAVVTLEGKLEENSSFDTHTDGDPKSNGREVYYVVWPDRPIAVDAGEHDAQPNMLSETNIDRFVVEGKNRDFQKMLNKRVKVTGKFLHSADKNAHTIVTMQVSTITVVE